MCFWRVEDKPVNHLTTKIRAGKRCRRKNPAAIARELTPWVRTATLVSRGAWRAAQEAVRVPSAALLWRDSGREDIRQVENEKDETECRHSLSLRGPSRGLKCPRRVTIHILWAGSLRQQRLPRPVERPAAFCFSDRQRTSIPWPALPSEPGLLFPCLPIAGAVCIRA